MLFSTHRYAVDSFTKSRGSDMESVTIIKNCSKMNGCAVLA